MTDDTVGAWSTVDRADASDSTETFVEAAKAGADSPVMTARAAPAPTMRRRLLARPASAVRVRVRRERSTFVTLIIHPGGNRSSTPQNHPGHTPDQRPRHVRQSRFAAL